MKNYEAMFIVKPDLAEEEKKGLFQQIQDAVTKNGGSVSSGNIWSEKKRLYFPIKKHQEGVYYLLNFNLAPEGIDKIRLVYKLNENVLRVLITSLG